MTSKINLEKGHKFPLYNLIHIICISIDPSLPKFKEWLNHLGAGEYVNRFLDAGYDLPFISKFGIKDDDLDTIGIPKSKLGLRRKLIELYKLKDFYEEEEIEDIEEEEDEEEDEDDDDEED